MAPQASSLHNQPFFESSITDPHGPRRWYAFPSLPKRRAVAFGEPLQPHTLWRLPPTRPGVMQEAGPLPTLAEALTAAQAEAVAARAAMALQDEALRAAAQEVEAAQEVVASKGAEVSQLQLKLDATLSRLQPDAGRPNEQEVDPMVQQRVQEAERAHTAQVRELAAQLQGAAQTHKTHVAGLEAELISYRLKGLQEAVASSSAHEPMVDEAAPLPPDMQMVIEELERVKTRVQHSQRLAEQARQELGEAQREGQAAARQLEEARETAALAGDDAAATRRDAATARKQAAQARGEADDAKREQQHLHQQLVQDAIGSERTAVKSHDREDAKALGAEAT